MSDSPNITLGIAEKHQAAAGDKRTKINDRIGFDAVLAQRLNGRFELGHVESQMLESDRLFQLESYRRSSVQLKGFGTAWYAPCPSVKRRFDGSGLTGAAALPGLDL
jgi:hypothetical protein